MSDDVRVTKHRKNIETTRMPEACEWFFISFEEQRYAADAISSCRRASAYLCTGAFGLPIICSKNPLHGSAR